VVATDGLDTVPFGTARWPVSSSWSSSLVLRRSLGPIIAAPPLYALNIWLASWSEWSTVFFAAIVIVLMRVYPAGVPGLIASAGRRWRR
jgi:hypothetical protein